MTVTKVWGKWQISGGFISTGISRIDHNLNHTKYRVHTQARQSGTTIVVDGIYSTYFTCSVRNSSGTLVSAPFDFSMIGDNYP